MINPTSLASISCASCLTPLAREGAAAPAGSFKDFLLNSIQEVNQMQVDADHAVESLVTGGDADHADVLSAVQKADLAFRMMMQIHNEVLKACQEVQDVRI